ncbi:MAG: hypothetical protein J0H07_10440 [Sphingobacteriales bacterium]|nr:hypothetical protein [Sphingobacteriales bacterium]
MSNDRIYTDVPNCAFHKILRQYAIEIGRPILTIQQQRIMLINYSFFAITLN